MALFSLIVPNEKGGRESGRKDGQASYFDAQRINDRQRNAATEGGRDGQKGKESSLAN